MRILDIDLDFFLDDITWDDGTGDRFVDGGGNYQPWSSADVRDFLETQCGLSAESPTPGKVVETHDEVLSELFELYKSEEFIEIVHVDAHADLGFQEMCLIHITTSLLDMKVADRLDEVKSKESEVTQGCYLLYALACQVLDDLTYVFHPEGGDDVPDMILRNFDLGSGSIELKLFDASMGDSITEETKVEKVDPPIPFEMIKGTEYQYNNPFDRVFLSRSPAYTPSAADPLIDTIKDYMCTAEHA